MRCRRVRREMAVYRELDAAGRAAVQEHLADCPTCAVRFRDYQAQDRLLADLVAIGPSPQLRERVWARTIDGAGSRGRDALARQPRYSVVTRWAAVTLVLLVVLLGGGAVGASADSLPGDVLYPVKRVSEQIRLACAVRTESREAYAQGLAELRRWEAQQVVAQRREVQVQFEGRVDLVDSEGIVVDGLRVRLHPGLPGLTPPAVGSVVSVQARAHDGQLAAEAVALRPTPPPGRSDAPAPAPTRIAPTTPPDTATPRPTASPKPPRHEAGPTATDMTPYPQPTAWVGTRATPRGTATKHVAPPTARRTLAPHAGTDKQATRDADRAPTLHAITTRRALRTPGSTPKGRTPGAPSTAAPHRTPTTEPGAADPGRTPTDHPAKPGNATREVPPSRIPPTGPPADAQPAPKAPGGRGTPARSNDGSAPAAGSMSR